MLYIRPQQLVRIPSLIAVVIEYEFCPVFGFFDWSERPKIKFAKTEAEKQSVADVCA